MTYYVHVNRHVINSNRKNDESNPAMRFQRGRYGKPTYAHRVRVKDGILGYLENPLPCGARVVITTEHKPEVVF